MKKFTRFLRRTAAAALCAAGLLSLTGCEKDYSKMLNEAPADYIHMALWNTAAAMSPVSDSGELLKKAMENGTVTAGFESDGITFKSEAVISQQEGACSQLMTMTGSSGASAQIYAYAGKNGAKIGTVGQSGSHIYDITYEGIAEKLAASIFAPQSDSMYAMSRSDYDELMMYIDQMAKAVQGASDGESADDKYAKIFKDYFDTNKPNVQEKTDADIDGEKVSANIISYSIPTADVKALADSVFTLYLEDIKASGQLPEYYDEEETKGYFKEFMDMLDECGIKAEYYINAETHVLMKSDFALNASVDGETIKVYVKSLFGADPANAPSQTFDAGFDIGGETVSFNMVKLRTNDGWILTASADFMGEKTDLFRVSLIRDGNNYTLVFSSPGDVVIGEAFYVKIEGTVDIGKTAFNMTVDKVTFAENGETVTIEPKAVVSIKTGGEVTVLDAEKELLDLTEEEMDALAESVEKDFGAIIDEANGSGAIGGYVRSSKISQANANAKNVHTCCTATVVQEYVDGNEYSGVIEGSGTNFTVGGKKLDVSNYLWSDFSGYVYGYVNEKTLSVEYTLWSKDPIPKEYRHQLTKEEQEQLADKKVFIGCFPTPQ